MKLSLNPLNTASIQAQLWLCAPASSTSDQYGQLTKVHSFFISNISGVMFSFVVELT